MLIKVCGMKYASNIAALSKLKIDYMGFIFAKKSKRFIKHIPKSVPGKIKKAGVFVNNDIDELKAVAKRNELDLIQLHGDEDINYCSMLKNEGLTLIKVFRIDENFDFSLCTSFSEYSDLFLFDTMSNQYGGTGRKFNWDILNEYEGVTPFLLSGGISSEDHVKIQQIEHERFAGIDINSKFEIKPALKDINKINTFIKKVKR